MTEAIASIKPRRKVPVIWLVPIVAALLGVWLVVYNYLNQGPTITINFSTAAGIQAGKTKIKSLDVELGVVTTVELTKDLSEVIVTAELESFARPLLTEDSQFWVVRPRIGPGGISGLGTILSGGHINLEAGTGKAGRKKFAGLDNPPVTPAGTPGLQVYLASERAGSVNAGDPVLFRGYRVGSVETTEFDASGQSVSYGLFIDAPYDKLVTENTRFWNASGITLEAGANGVKLELGSLQSLLVGGVAFDLPDGVLPGVQVKNGEEFALFANLAAANRKSYDNFIQFVVAFDQSVRGLRAGAPVEYRGIQIGTVERLLIRELVSDGIKGSGDPIPVLLKIEPARLGLPDTAAAVTDMQEAIAEGVKRGLRAKLGTGNLLTGSSIIDIDYVDNAAPAGLARIQRQLGNLLAKLNDLPLEPAIANLNATLVDLQSTLGSVNGLVASDATQAIPVAINDTLRELNATLDAFSPDSQNADSISRSLSDLNQTLRNLESLTRTLSAKPNSIIFAPPVTVDPVPQRKD